MNKYDRNKLFPNYPSDAINLITGLSNCGMTSYLNSIASMMSSINKDLSVQLCDSIKLMSEIALDYRNSTSKIMEECILSITDLAILSTDSMSAFSSYIESFQSIATEIAQISSTIPLADTSEDYITISESCVEEFELPDSIALPIGNKRVRVKTEFILSLLVTIFFSLITFVQSECHERKSLETEQQYYDSKLQEERKQNQMIEKLIDSIDYSESAHSDSVEALTKSIESLTELIQSSEAAHQEIDSNPDEASENPCNNHE
ncbi:MAG: hypothetical protein KH313_03435 [Lachnospiraceae bacterium]|nr:hypothetical protein [Lachnospiraceae bacterium]